ncbi:MAG TPA: hypothetical protein VLV25_12015 [Steroidobacteraceae bacterium]|nr:hypothetical protein [Steroidobacteraceae bacterium]
MPGTWLCGLRRVKVIHVIDWAARRDAAGAGSVLMKHIAQQADALLAIGGSAETVKMLPTLGFRTTGALRGYVRTLHPLRLLRGLGKQRVRGFYRAARSAMSSLGAPTGARSGWRARRLSAGALAEISSVLPTARPGMSVAQRSAALLAYALECPIVPLALYLVEHGGRARGYFLIASAPGQVRIADCWVDSEAPDEWRALLACTIAQAAADPPAAEIVGWANDELTANALEACGFRARHSAAIQLRPRTGAKLPAESLRVQMLDSDAAYFHEGRKEFWS